MARGQIRIDKNDIVGKRLGKLEVIGYSGNYYAQTNGGKRLRHFYVCECDCSAVKYVRRSSLKNDKVHSCGCGRKKHGS